MSKQDIVKLEKGTVMKSSLTKAPWRRKTGTAAYPQPANFYGQYKYLKCLVFECLYGYNTDNYSTSIKEVVDYIVRKLYYSTDITSSAH